MKHIQHRNARKNWYVPSKWASALAENSGAQFFEKAIIVSFCTLCFVFGLTSQAQAESVYERVMRTRTIECGYFVEPPFTVRNEATGEFSGLSVDLINLIAKDLNLKVKWKEKISFATFPEDLNNNKYDMVCGSIFVLPRAGRMDYTNAYSYVSMLGYVRPDNNNFDKPFKDIDWSKVSISGLDGEGATTAAQKLLPEAKMQVLPQLSNISEMLLVVATGKADIGFVLPSVFEDFNKANPKKLRKAKLLAQVEQGKQPCCAPLGYWITRKRAQSQSTKIRTTSHKNPMPLFKHHGHL